MHADFITNFLCNKMFDSWASQVTFITKEVFIMAILFF